MQVMSPASRSGMLGHMTMKTPCCGAACYNLTAQDMSVSSNLPLSPRPTPQ